ncbi:MAG: alanine--tRNA ligase, partial [Planctomycetota bacterium]
FAERGHALPPAAPLLPENHPTLLFTGAGMNQFKDLFLGRGKAPYRRAATVQPCFRQGDLENVGRTPRHLTFFEMLGHFSFGDYFKKEAVAWAWEFLTRVLEVPADRLWISIYEEDEEAFDAWRAVGVARDRIARFDAGENFWPANAPADGPDGVCGPCSEVFYDYGEARTAGDGGRKGYDSGRFIEIWNSVFTQFERRGANHLVPLPQQNIDCGVGFERVLAMVEGQYSVFSTSLFRPLMEAVAAASGHAYAFPENGDMPPGGTARRMRRIADHVRSACLLASAGVKPSNEGRGYVLRRILRLAIRDGIQLGIDEPFLAGLVDPVVSMMGGGYPELRDGREALVAVVSGEETRFRATYSQGLRFLEDAARGLGRGATLDGRAAFKLHDTYGFPLDLAARILEERGIGVDRDGFDAEMEKQRERARRGSKIVDSIFAGGPSSELKAAGVERSVFVGYGCPDAGSEAEAQGVAAHATVVGIVGGDEVRTEAVATERVALVLDTTPFYAESGGQVGDRGVILAEGLRFEVVDTQSRDGYVLHP